MNEIKPSYRHDNPLRELEILRAENEALRQQLASVAKERDEIAAQARMLDCMVDERDEQLAAALAAVTAKDAILKVLHDEYVWSHEPMFKEVSSILTIKPDASALKAHNEALIERCAKLAETEDSYILAEAIRELKEKP